MGFEDDLRALRLAGQLDAAAERAVRKYGPEVMGFLVTLLRDEIDAGEVYAQACEDLWRGFAAFEERASVRTWFYVVARHAAARFRRSAHRAAARRASISEAEDVAEPPHSATVPYFRTEARDRFASIRDSLSTDDCTLLIMRVDRKMGWNDVARVLAPPGANDEEIARGAARLRKRYQLLKDEIRARVRGWEAGTEADP